jgi:glucokinase
VGVPVGEVFAAVDVGGTKIAVALVDGAGGVLGRFEEPTPARDVLGTVLGLLDRLAAEPAWSAVPAVGIGSAGPIDASRGTVSPVNIPDWREFPLVAHVAEHTGLPVTLAGDGVAMAAGEHWRGAARGRRNALCMVVSTGVGGGLILDGRLRTGPSGNAGHIGHMTVELEGDPCPCGSRGCVEIIASGRAIARRAVANGWQAPDGGAATAAAVATSALAGDEIALASFDRSARALAAGIAGTAALCDLEVAVIGGGVAKAGELLFGPLRRHLEEYARLSFTKDLEVEPAALGGDAGLIGAAALVANVG